MEEYSNQLENSGQPNYNPRDPEIKDFYSALSHFAIHGQENKWWMLYIFLVFNSILVLSCSTIIASQSYFLINEIALTLFSVAGFIINGCWLFMAFDYVSASNLFGEIAADAEKWLPNGVRKPLTERQIQRKSKPPFGTSKFIATILPIIFIIIYIILLVLAWQPSLHQVV